MMVSLSLLLQAACMATNGFSRFGLSVSEALRLERLRMQPSPRTAQVVSPNSHADQEFNTECDDSKCAVESAGKFLCSICCDDCNKLDLYIAPKGRDGKPLCFHTSDQLCKSCVAKDENNKITIEKMIWPPGGGGAGEYRRLTYYRCPFCRTHHPISSDKCDAARGSPAAHYMLYLAPSFCFVMVLGALVICSVAGYFSLMFYLLTQEHDIFSKTLKMTFLYAAMVFFCFYMFKWSVAR